MMGGRGPGPGRSSTWPPSATKSTIGIWRHFALSHAIMSGRVLHPHAFLSTPAAGRLDLRDTPARRCPARASSQAVSTAARGDDFATEQSGGREATGIAASLDAAMAAGGGQDEKPYPLRPGLKEEGLAYYQALKATLGRTHLKAAGFLTGYLFLTATSDAALLAALGAAAGHVYLQLLIRDVDGINAADGRVAPFLASADSQLSLWTIGNPGKLLAAYRGAVRARMLIPVGLAAAMLAYNTLNPEHPLTLTQEGCLLGGFLSYKAPLLLQIWEATKPRFDPDRLNVPARPVLPDLGDEEPESVWADRINRSQ